MLALCDAIRQAGGCSLRTLSLSANKISDCGFGGLAEVMRLGVLPALVSLNLSANHVGDEGVIAFCRGPWRGRKGPMACLETLWLDSNRVGDAGCAALAAAITAGALASIEDIYLKSNVGRADAVQAALDHRRWVRETLAGGRIIKCAWTT
mmetsp:Transcript_6644/g.17265  ORF Transcript_6644/g.17265 Transcript_6644/m.17265 type:complete len:151 (+) Transcript_6644:224-676(+)